MHNAIRPVHNFEENVIILEVINATLFRNYILKMYEELSLQFKTAGNELSLLTEE